MSRLPRAYCAFCGRMAPVRVNGTMREHKGITGNPPRVGVCPGSGRPPETGVPVDVRIEAVS